MYEGYDTRFSIDVEVFRNSMNSSLYGGAAVCMRDTIQGFLRESRALIGAFQVWCILIGLCVLLPLGWVVTIVEILLLESFPFVAVADSPGMFLECFIVYEVFLSSGSCMRWYVLLRSQFDGFVVELSESTQSNSSDQHVFAYIFQWDSSPP